MTVEEAQCDIRTAFAGGFVGQFVSALLWAASGVLSVTVGTREAMFALVVGGMFIFPLTAVGLRILGYRGRVADGNPLGGLGWQSAFVVPLCIPVIAAAAAYRVDWFYPAFMIVVGAHYLSFVTLYGMRMFAVLAAILVGGGVLLGLYGPGGFVIGAWITAPVLLVFAFLGRAHVRAEDAG